MSALFRSGSRWRFCNYVNQRLSTRQVVPNARLIVYPGAPHGLAQTHHERFNADLLSFIRTGAVTGSKAA